MTHLNSLLLGARITSAGTTLRTDTLCSDVPWYRKTAFSPSFCPGRFRASLTMMTSGTFALGARLLVKRLFSENAWRAERKALRVGCEVKMLGRSSSRIKRRVGAGADGSLAFAFVGLAPPCATGLKVLKAFAGIGGGEAEVDACGALGAIILLSAVSVPKARAEVTVALLRKDGN